MARSEQSKQKLLECIRQQREAGEPKLPPERELAVRFHCSRATMAKLLRELESEGLVERRVGSGTYIRIPQPERTPVHLAVVMRNVYYPADEHFRRILEILAGLAHERRISIRIFDGLLELFSEHPDDNALLRAIREKTVNGILVVSRLPLSILGRISALCPTAAINNIFGDGSEIRCVSCDYFRVGYLAGKYLLAKGHRKIAYVTDDLNHPESSVELSGFQTVLESAGIHLTPSDILETRRNPALVNGRAGEFFLKALYTGCFVRNTTEIGNLMRALKRNAIRCPDDLEVVVSGSRGSRTECFRNLAVIDNRMDDMCRTALDILIRLVRGEKESGRNLILLPPRPAELNNGCQTENGVQYAKNET